MNLSEIKIINLIPQREPFVMVDHLVKVDENSTQSEFEIKLGNILTVGNYFTEAGMIENIAQTAAARSGYESIIEKKQVQLGYIGSIKNLEISILPSVGDKIFTEVKTINQIFNVNIIKGSVFLNDKIIASCEMKIFINS